MPCMKAAIRVYDHPRPCCRAVHSSSRHHPDRSLTFLVTAYCPCRICCNKADGITATSVKAKAGRTVAADPRLIPLGTKLKVEGMGIMVAEDAGGAIGGRRLDVFFSSHRAARIFGRRWLRVWILPRAGAMSPRRDIMSKAPSVPAAQAPTPVQGLVAQTPTERPWVGGDCHKRIRNPTRVAISGVAVR